MDVFVARQPIFNKKRHLIGYELLFRSGMDNAFPDLDGDTATSSLLSSSFFSVGIDRISGGVRSFINFTDKLLVRGTPTLFPQESIVVEILETVTPSPQVVEACRLLKRKGYLLALDDFVFAEQYADLLPLIDIVKVDFQQSNQAEVSSLAERLRPYQMKFLAEKIETYEEFHHSIELGYSYFQGYFFAKPEILKNKEIPQNKLSMLRLISQVNNNAEFDTTALEQLISREVAVSFKLLSYLNSAYFARISPLKSIKQAVTFLGEKGIRLFVSLIAASRLAEDKPDELVRLSIIRARLLDLLSSHVSADSGELFMLGLFSLIDAMLDNPMEVLVMRLPISEPVRQALVERTGSLAVFIDFVESIEHADWQVVTKYLQTWGIDAESLSAMQLDAIGWADSFNAAG